MIRSRVTLATTEAAAIEKLRESPLTMVRTGQAIGGRNGAVDQRGVGSDGERLDGPRHRQQRGAQNIEPIDLARARRSDADPGRAAPGAAP